ncbi:MAG: hypothetical protein QOK40_2752 [Miltoncostaeaceae bacterium]|nr:hypothetical protein [Miltoncostaeaceae bacterium]
MIDDVDADVPRDQGDAPALRIHEFDLATLHELDADPHHVTYAGRVVPHRDARWFLAWIGYQDGETFLGELAPPRAVAVDSDGTLTLEQPR